MSHPFFLSLPLPLSCLLNETSVQAVHPRVLTLHPSLPGMQSQGGPALDRGPDPDLDPGLLEAAMSDHAGETPQKLILDL